MITELRRYRIRPDRLDSWLDFFADAAREQAAVGIRVEYAGVDRETCTFVWLRSFDDEADRVGRKEAFYGSDWWTERESFAMSHVVEYDVTFLDAVIVRDGHVLPRLELEPRREVAGSRGDGPPDGWTTSTRRSFVPVLER